MHVNVNSAVWPAPINLHSSLVKLIDLQSECQSNFKPGTAEFYFLK